MKTHIPASSSPLHGDEGLARSSVRWTVVEQKKGGSYPLYDVPYLVRDPNEYRMSAKRHQIEVRNQAVVDDYFLSRANGATAREARETVATKHGITPKRVLNTLTWFFHEAEKRRKYDFLQKFSLSEEH